ncbi:uncharacterized protein LTR77_000582 [Saxophila tyrrhenica]|uniref:Uncharacterized protein n=1 Tax=Saxophila tyrrhenica TaxID=1690608 RepID=A0AAV9PQC6_9PEZI|nr:hypothetical protein LTR77_000582 [Saxophila tyrrhenica]
MSKEATTAQPSGMASGKQPGAVKPILSQRNNSIVDNDLDVPDLSFGVELEYMFASLTDRSDGKDWPNMSADGRGQEVVREALSGTMMAECRVCKQSFRFKLPLNTKAGWPYDGVKQLDPNPDLLDDYDNDYMLWDVVEENLYALEPELQILGEIGDKYTCTGLEVRSRILSPRRDLGVRDPSSATCKIHKISCQQEISAVMHTLRRRFCDFSNGRRNDYLFANKRCGLHVHVGTYGTQYELKDVKNVMSMYAGCERLIDSIHAPHRISWTDLGVRPYGSVTADDLEQSSDYDRDPSVYNIPLSAPFLLNVHRRRYPNTGAVASASGSSKPLYPDTHISDAAMRLACSSRHVGAWIHLIQMAPDIADLQALYGTRSKKTVLNIRNLQANNPEPLKTTIEFRQYASTMLTEPILSWVDFVVKLVYFNQQNSWATVYEKLHMEAVGEDTFAQFVLICSDIDCDEETKNHYPERLRPNVGTWVRNLRAGEKAQALAAKPDSDSLAALALHSIEEERKDMDERSARRKMCSKLREGGYGQFDAGVADKIALELGFWLIDEEAQQLTIGFEPQHFSHYFRHPLPQTVHRPPPSEGGFEEDFGSPTPSTASMRVRGTTPSSLGSPYGYSPSPPPPLLAGKVRSTTPDPRSAQGRDES